MGFEKGFGIESTLEIPAVGDFEGLGFKVRVL